MNRQTTHRIINGDAQNLQQLSAHSVALVVTSPPYPMIEMWDELFSQHNTATGIALKAEEGRKAFETMHEELDRVWEELERVLIPGGIACINIGDATRKLGDAFALYANHA